MSEVLINPYKVVAPGVPFDNFVCKWNSGGTATTVVGISRLSYFPTNVDELGLEYGFLFRANFNDYWQTIKDGSIMTDVDAPIDSDTEFKLTYDGTTMKWFVDDDEKDSESATLSGTYYLWTNSSESSPNVSIQCQYGGADAEWTGYDGDGASWQGINPNIVKDGGTSWGSGVYALAQKSIY